MHKISMEIVSETIQEVKKEDIGNVSFGGFNFLKDDKHYMFDFEAYGCSLEQNENNKVIIIYKSGEGLLFNEYEIDECYKEEFENQKIEFNSVDAKMLSEIDEIDEISYELFSITDFYNEHIIPIKIKSITFYDLDNEKTKEYKIDQMIINKFNDKINKEEN